MKSDPKIRLAYARNKFREGFRASRESSSHAYPHLTLRGECLQYIDLSRNAISLNLQVQLSLFERESLLLGSILIQHGLHNWLVFLLNRHFHLRFKSFTV